MSQPAKALGPVVNPYRTGCCIASPLVSFSMTEVAFTKTLTILILAGVP
jgi:hypothetical protein